MCVYLRVKHIEQLTISNHSLTSPILVRDKYTHIQLFVCLSLARIITYLARRIYDK